MGFVRVDGFGVSVLVRGRSEARRVRLYDVNGAELTVANGGTVTLYDASGTSLGSGTTSSGTATYTVSSGSAVGVGFEVWDVTASGTAYKFRLRVLVGHADIACPINDDDVEQVMSVLDGSYPSGETSWAKHIRRGWDRVLREVVRRTRVNYDGELYTGDDLYDAALAAVVHQIALDASAFGSARWADIAVNWGQRYEHEIERAMLRYGTDNDAGPDTDPHRLGTGAAIGERQFGRIG
jgi:hypothetical protein